MKKLNLLIISLFTFGTSFSQSYTGPESVEYDAVGDRYFVSNASNGQIIARANNGTLSIFASGLANGPHGLEIVGTTLYACSGGFIRGFDLVTGTQIVTVNLGGTFLNGITHKGTDLFITDFSAKKVYRFNTLNNAFNVFITGLTKTPNGIIYDDINDRLVMVNWGTSAPIIGINLTDSTYSTLTATSLGNCDGIAMNCSGQFYVASWSPNRISRFDGDFLAPPTNMNVTGLSNPADIYYNQIEDTLAIPNAGNNTVGFVQYNDCSTIGISSDDHEINFSLYPNPSNSKIIIEGEFSNSPINITDLSGKIILNSILINSKNEIDISNFNNGIYFITINSTTQKLMIQR